MFNLIRNVVSGIKEFLFGKEPKVYPGDEFRCLDLLVEIGSGDQFVVLNSLMNGYSLSFRGEYEDFQYGRGLPYFAFQVSKETAHETYVKVGYWDNKNDMFVEHADDVSEQ